MNPLDRVAKLQEGFVKGATVELQRDFLGEGSLFPNWLDLGEPLWVSRPQIVDFENPDSGSWGTARRILVSAWSYGGVV